MPAREVNKRLVMSIEGHQLVKSHLPIPMQCQFQVKTHGFLHFLRNHPFSKFELGVIETQTKKMTTRIIKKSPPMSAVLRFIVSPVLAIVVLFQVK